MHVVHKEQGNFEIVYILGGDAVMYYPRLITPQQKHQSDDKQYSTTIFVDSETRDKLENPVESDGLFINKQFYEVGVDKNKKKKIKFPTSDQVEEGERNYDAVKGMHGVSLTAPEFTKKGKPSKIVIVDAEGKPFDTSKMIGTGSKGNFRMWGWRNDDGQLNVTLDLVQITELVEVESKGGFDDVMGIDLTKSAVPPEMEPSVDFDDDIPF